MQFIVSTDYWWRLEVKTGDIIDTAEFDSDLYKFVPDNLTKFKVLSIERVVVDGSTNTEIYGTYEEIE